MDARLRSRDGGLRAAAPVAWLAHGSDYKVGAPVRGRGGPAIRPGCLVAVPVDVTARGKVPDSRHVAVGLHEWQDHSQRARAGLRHLRVEEIRAVGHRCRTELHVVTEGTRCSLPVFAARRARQQRGHHGTAGSHRSGRQRSGRPVSCPSHSSRAATWQRWSNLPRRPRPPQAVCYYVAAVCSASVALLRTHPPARLLYLCCYTRPDALQSRREQSALAEAQDSDLLEPEHVPSRRAVERRPLAAPRRRRRAACRDC